MAFPPFVLFALFAQSTFVTKLLTALKFLYFPMNIPLSACNALFSTDRS